MPIRQTGGGQWTKNAVGGSAQAFSIATDKLDPYSVVLAEEEAGGGHTIREHVAVTDEALQDHVRGQMGRWFLWNYGTARGRFFSKEAANDYVNRVLRLNMTMVDAVVAGSRYEQLIEQRIGSVTGTEAYSDGSFDPIMRSTYSVRVVIRHDAGTPRGYRVITAFPMNERKGNQ